MENIKSTIKFTDFLEIEKQLDIRIGLIVTADRLPKSTKLLRLTVSFDGETNPEGLTSVVTNLGATLEPEFFVGAKLPFIVNLEPVTMMGQLSQAMIVVGKNTKEEIELGNYSIGTKII